MFYSQQLLTDIFAKPRRPLPEGYVPPVYTVVARFCMTSILRRYKSCNAAGVKPYLCVYRLDSLGSETSLKGRKVPWLDPSMPVQVLAEWGDPFVMQNAGELFIEAPPNSKDGYDIPFRMMYMPLAVKRGYIQISNAFFRVDHTKKVNTFCIRDKVPVIDYVIGCVSLTEKERILCEMGVALSDRRFPVISCGRKASCEGCPHFSTKRPQGLSTGGAPRQHFGICTKFASANPAENTYMNFYRNIAAGNTISSWWDV